MSDLCCVIDCFRLVISIYVIIHGIITSAEEVMFSPVTTGWFLCQQNTQKLLKKMFMKLGWRMGLSSECTTTDLDRYLFSLSLTLQIRDILVNFSRINAW